MKLRRALAVCALAAGAAGALAAQPLPMSPEWPQGACEAWNRDTVPTDQLVDSG